MKTDELIEAREHLQVQTGSLACLGCGHEHSCGVHGCAIAREAAVRLSLYEHALEQVAKERDTLLAQLKRLGGCIGHMNTEARLIEQNGWINARGRLPERGVPVLTYNKWGRARVETLRTWDEQPYFVGGLKAGTDVLFWRPLPQLPEVQ